MGALVAAACFGGASLATAAPIVTLELQARKTGTLDAFSSSITPLAAGELFDYRVVARMADVGTVNQFDGSGATGVVPSGAGAKTVSAYTPGTGATPSATAHGFQSARFHVYQLASDATQVDFNSAALLGAGFNLGIGNSGGTLSNRADNSALQDLAGISAVLSAGNRVGIDASGNPIDIVVASGSFEINSLGISDSFLRLGATAINGGSTTNSAAAIDVRNPGSIGVKFNDNASNSAMSIALGNVTDVDPFFGYNNLTIIAVPEPSGFSLIALGMISAWQLRKRKRLQKD